MVYAAAQNYVTYISYIFVLCVLQKDPGFDRGQFHKQVAVMRGQVSSEHVFEQ